MSHVSNNVHNFWFENNKGALIYKCFKSTSVISPATGGVSKSEVWRGSWIHTLRCTAGRKCDVSTLRHCGLHFATTMGNTAIQSYNTVYSLYSIQWASAVIKHSTMLLKIILYKGPNCQLTQIQWIYGQIYSLIVLNRIIEPYICWFSILFGLSWCMVTLYYGNIKH